MPLLILIRHGQSTYNFENRFTGDLNVDLTLIGKGQARLAGNFLKNIPIQIAYTSTLNRAIDTLQIVLKEIGSEIPIIQSPALNERNYGDLQGLNKIETEAKYGCERVLEWRRSFKKSPPNGESLEDVYNRVVPYYKNEIEEKLKADLSVLVVAHSNCLRALMIYLEQISISEISTVNIAAGIPKVYEYDSILKLQNVHYLP